MNRLECKAALSNAGFECRDREVDEYTSLYENHDLAVECIPLVEYWLEDGWDLEDIDVERSERCWPYVLLYVEDPEDEDSASYLYAGASCSTDICDEGFILESYGSQYKEGGAYVTSVSDALSTFERIVGPGGTLERYGWTLRK